MPGSRAVAVKLNQGGNAVGGDPSVCEMKKEEAAKIQLQALC